MRTSNNTPGSWAPPFCPNPNCRFHNGNTSDWHYKKIGTFRRLQPPFRIQRFTCKTCGRSFSTQTFSTTYWQKLPNLDAQLITKITGGMAARQVARDLKVSPETVDRHIARLGRHCLLFHQQIMQNCPPPSEVVVDGFESFEYSQYFPMHHHVAVEKGTDFFIYFTDSELRRKGRMTEVQKRRRQELEMQLGRPDPKAIEKDMRELLEVVLQDLVQATVYSDDHPAYKRSIRKLKTLIDHRITPGSAHRSPDNDLWEANLVDLLIRHCNANHKRETIAWSKRRQGSAYRLAIFLVWRNYMKGRQEKEHGSPTPAMVKGLMDKPLTAEDLLKERLFRTRCELPPRWAEYYDQQVVTRAIPRNRTHDLKLAY